MYWIVVNLTKWCRTYHKNYNSLYFRLLFDCITYKTNTIVKYEPKSLFLNSSITVLLIFRHKPIKNRIKNNLWENIFNSEIHMWIIQIFMIKAVIRYWKSFFLWNRLYNTKQNRKLSHAIKSCYKKMRKIKNDYTENRDVIENILFHVYFECRNIICIYTIFYHTIYLSFLLFI